MADTAEPNTATGNPAQADLMASPDLGIDLSTQMRYVVANSFDYQKFSKAVQKDASLTDGLKKHLVSAFSPTAKVHFSLNHPEKSLSALVNNAIYQIDLDAKQAPLPAGHPVAKMWDEVWQQTLVHYAGEAALYEQRMGEKGRSIVNDLKGYPVLTPPISIAKNIPLINAAAGLSENHSIEAMVTQDFLDRLSPEQQRAVLFHEAQHAFEPVLAGKPPVSTFVTHALQSLVTAHHVGRQWEWRADTHAGHMGAGEHLQSAFQLMEETAKELPQLQRTVLRHLVNNGFAINARKFGAVLDKAHEEAHDQGFGSFLPASIVPKENRRINPEVLEERVAKFNDAIRHAAYKDLPVEKPEGGLSQRIRNIIRDHTASHPHSDKRVKALDKVTPCGGCASPDPTASHGDRIKTISPTGIQGFSR